MKKKWIGFALLSMGWWGQACAQANPAAKIEQAFRLIQDNYVDKIDDQRLSDAAIEGMLSVLDPHCRYFTTSGTEEFDNVMGGKYYGVGIRYMMENDSVYVSEVIPDGPAERAGLIMGDRITAIDTIRVAGAHLDNRDIYNMLRGGNDQPVTVKVEREGSAVPLVFSLKRAAIPDHSVSSCYMVNDSIGYIALRIFNRNTRIELDAALDSLKGRGMKSLILDLQDNGGGAVESAIGTADEFLKGEKMVFYSVPRDGGKDYYYTGGAGKFMEGRLVVLINQSTASASEIVAGALQDWDRAVIVGRRSFGKGITQRGYPLQGGALLDITNARYFTPAGRSLQKSYAKGNAIYNAEVNARFTDGEVYDSSRMKVADSLRSVTLVSQRPMIGGAGIIPDVYVPFDSLQLNPWYSLLGQSNLGEKAAFGLVRGHRGELLARYPAFENFREQFETPASFWKELSVKLPMAKHTGKREEQHLRQLVNNDGKAIVARLLYGRHVYFTELSNENNPSYQRAIRLLEQPDVYDTILRKR